MSSLRRNTKRKWEKLDQLPLPVTTRKKREAVSKRKTLKRLKERALPTFTEARKSYQRTSRMRTSA
jgi:hypothetical protein